MAIPQECLVVLDVGHGNSTFIRCGGRTVLVDAGPKSRVLEFLDREGIKELSEIFVSHSDEDHIAGLLAIVSSTDIVIGAVRLNSDSLKSSAIWDDLLYELDQRSHRGTINFLPALTAAQNGEFDDNRLTIEILGPSTYLAAKGPGSRNRAGLRIGTNSVSAVLRLSIDQQVLALLPGDVDVVGLTDLLDHQVDMSAPILVFPHHGGGAGAVDLQGFTTQLLDQVRPSSVVFSIGRGKHRTPRPAVINALRMRVEAIQIACTQLSENCAAVLPMNASQHLLPVFASGNEGGACCAGSLVVNLEDEERVWLNRSAHENFVLGQVPGSLCRS